MTFQWVINNASSIAIDRNPIVGQTITRNQTVRTISRGAGIWKFTVQLPNGISWQDARGYISQIEYLNKTSVASISMNDVGKKWLYKYQGNSANYTGFSASITTGSNTITLTSSPVTTSGYKFKAGDFIQLGSSGRVYTVAADVAYNSNIVILHRPVYEATASNVSLKVAENVSWNVVCMQLPTWSLDQRDMVSWSGPFIFYENMV
jgi:hypothetical protein